MALTTFTSGQILTAAQMNAVQANDYNQTVSTKTASYTLVAADKGTRVVMNSASATTITVNTSLFSAGDTLVLQNIGAGVCTVTAGTATVSTAGSLAIPQNGSGLLYFISAGVSIYYPSAVTVSSGLTFITTGTFSAVASVSMAASTFTTTYKTYKVILNITSTSGAQNLALRVNASGTPQTTANYEGGFAAINDGGTVSGIGNDAATSFVGIAIHSTQLASMDLTIFNPADASLRTGFSGTARGAVPGGASGGSAGGGVFNSAAASDGLTFLVAGTFGGTYYVYGMKDS